MKYSPMFFYALIICSTLGMLGFNCRKGPRSKEPDRYYNPSNKFSIQLPKKWEIKENVMGAPVVALSPREGPADIFRENVNVMVETLPAKINLDQYLDASLTNMRKLLTDYSEKESGPISLGGEKAWWGVYSHRMGQLKLEVLYYTLLSSGRAYTITCSAYEGSLLKYRKVFEQISHTFRIED